MAAITGLNPKKIGIIHHPCTQEATDRNWDAVRRGLEDLAKDVNSINEEITELSPVSWGIVKNDSEEGDCDTVVVNPCSDCEGASPVATDVTVILPKRDGWFPKLREGDVIAYASTTSGDFVCVSDYSEGIVYYGVSTGANQTQPAAENGWCGEIEVQEADDCENAAAGELIQVNAPWYPDGEFYCPEGTRIIYAKAEDGTWVWLNGMQKLNDPVAYHIRRFRLTSSLALMGSASAVLLNWNGVGWVEGNAITVNDEQPSPGRWKGELNYEGWCTPRGESATDWSIVWMDLIALRITGTLNEDMSETTPDASLVANVTHYHQGRNPGTTVDVWDPNNRFPSAVVDAKFTALYNDRRGRYELETCEQVALWGVAELEQGACGGEMQIKNFEIIPIQEYSLDPPIQPTVAMNPRNHAGLMDNEVLLQRRNEGTEISWEVVDIDLSAIETIVDIYVDGRDLWYKTWTIHTEICDGPNNEDTRWHRGTYCDEGQQQTQ